ncbi:MAG TPA: serine/threonine-protein kinase, partial [bacterium]
MNVEIGNKYQVLHEIKRGGFGIIYKGMDRHLDKLVAIKAIDPKFLGEARYLDMFQREATSIAQLNHHNIVQVYDIKRDSWNHMYIIMEYVDGPDLMTLLRASRRKNITMPRHLGVHIVAEVCSALDYAHNRRDSVRGEPMNIIHQDISPVNIMLARAGEVKIIDFGMANLRRDQSKIGSEVFVQGNIHYLAPEQVNGSTAVDRRCDIFAAGLILFEILTGERLIKSSQPREIIESLVSGNWDVIRFNSEKIPEKLRDPIRQALEHDPRNRYPNANSFYKDLTHYLLLASPAADFQTEISQFIRRVESAEIADAETVVLEAGRTVNLAMAKPTTVDEAFGLENPVPDGGPDVHVSPDSRQPGNNVGDHSYPLQSGEALRLNVLQSAPRSDTHSSRYYTIVDETDEDAQRTIIDVVRLSARTHKKAVTLGVLALLLLALLFVAADTFVHFTKVGTGIYDFLFPPAIKIVSVPDGAQVYLDDALLSQTTPLSLDQISPGVHKLMLTLPKFEPMAKSINVPRSGVIHVAGEARRHASQPYIFRFKNHFEFSSAPPGAEIILDGTRTSQKTPATVFWDVSEKPLDISLELPGLPALSGLRINTLEGKEYIEDRRFWSVTRIVPGKAQFNISGTFYKAITIRSNPERADIYLNGSQKPVGVTGLNGELLLKIGNHRITLTKSEYRPRTFDLTVNTSTPTTIHHELMRPVKIFAQDAGADDATDLGAELVELSAGGKTVAYNVATPALVELAPKTYTAKLRKPGYPETFVEIPPSE